MKPTTQTFLTIEKVNSSDSFPVKIILNRANDRADLIQYLDFKNVPFLDLFDPEAMAPDDSILIFHSIPYPSERPIRHTPKRIYT